MRVKRCYNSDSMGRAAAAFCAEKIIAAVAARGHARVILATGASQFKVLGALIKDWNNRIPWDKVTVFHLDEYVGLAETHKASFKGYLPVMILQRTFVD